MFEVRTNSPMDDKWMERDKAIEEAAGVRSQFSGSGVGSNAAAGRDHGWRVPTFDEALAMKDRLNAVPDVVATVREL